MRMLRVLTPFRRLRWKLTFSYTLATVAAVLALEVVGLCALLALFSSPEIQLNLVQEAAATLAQEAEPYLSALPPDRAGLQLWLRQTVPPQAASRTVSDIDIDADLATSGRQTTLTFGQGDRIAVLGPAGQTLAASPDLLAANPGSQAPFTDPHGPGESEQIVAQALRGEPAGRRLQDRSLLVAQPVVGEQGQVLGAIYLRVTSFRLLASNMLAGALGLLGASALVLIVGAGIVGTLFGILVAHGLVRRLEALSGTTEAWGQGDLGPRVHDTSPDEIGQLSRRLDLMAGEFQTLLQARQELATLEERNRLARDLHDSVKQQVFATTMTLGTVGMLWERDPEAARQKVAQALALSRQAQQELSGLIHELRPVALEDKGLALALGEYVARWTAQSGIAADFTVQGEGSVPQDAESALYRVAQEALANAAQHSAARRVGVLLSFPGGSVQLEVGDDGRGFVPTQAAGRGMGLRSMRERVEALGGELVVDSAPGQGTRITARCPLASPGPGQ